MDLSVLFKGLLAGITIAMPLGPVNLICIHRTLSRGSKNGLISGLGAATADTIYGTIAGFGLTLVSSFLINHQISLRVFGGIFILFLGIRVIMNKPHDEENGNENRGLFRAFTSTFFLTLTNPLTILAFLGIFAGLGLTTNNINYLRATILVSGVFLGSSLWWSLLSGGVNFFREKFTDETLTRISRISGMIISLFGLFLIASVFLNINLN